MSLSKSFSEEQIKTVQSWADAGDGLSAIQKKLSSEMKVKVTYIELRFLLDDLGIKLKEEEDSRSKKAGESDVMKPGPKGNEAVVTIAAVQRPGTLMSGSVQFAGGKEAEWWIDRSGHPGMSPKDESFRPNQEQMVSFQKELQKALRSRGF